MVQLSHLYRTTGKTIALTTWIFIGKVMSLLFNMLSRFVIAFLPESKRLLISWLQFLSTVILEPPKIKSVTVSIFRVEYTQSYPTLCDPMNNIAQQVLPGSLRPHEKYSPAGPSVHGILQARILEWVAISFSREFFQLRD